MLAKGTKNASKNKTYCLSGNDEINFLKIIWQDACQSSYENL
jgi:hypothetical protein